MCKVARQDDRKGKRSKKKVERFVMVEHALLRSRAGQELDPYDWLSYVMLRAKFNGKNGKDLSLTYSEMERRMSRERFSKSITNLVRVGVIDVIASGGLYKRPNIFGLSDRWKNYGTEFFEASRRYVPDI